jgi:hypothetical protein
MTFEKGWINRQFARLERDSQKWPDWMRRETALRAAADSSSPSPAQGSGGGSSENLQSEPKVAKAQGW